MNPETKSHIRALALELNESTNAVRLELNRLLEVSMLGSYKEGNKIIYHVNEKHPLYYPVNVLLKKHTGIDEIIQNILKGLGSISKVYLGGSLAQGIESEIIDVILVGEINRNYLVETLTKLENKVSKKIRYLIFSEAEALHKNFEEENYLLIYSP